MSWRMEETPLTYRIQRSMNAGDVTLSLSGQMDSNHAAELQALLATEPSRLIHLDLADVTLVDRDAITFLARVEKEGVVLVNCPDYVRTWIMAEQRRT